MAGYIQFGGTPGLTTYITIWDQGSDQVWNGSSFETKTAGNFANYKVAATEFSTSGIYTATFPSAISSGQYFIAIHKQAGGSPNISADRVIGQDKGVWNGSDWHSGLSFTTTQRTQINTEVTDVVFLSPMDELSIIPGSTPTLTEAVTLLFMFVKNANTATATLRTIKNAAGTTIGSATLSDDGTTFNQGKLS